MCWTKEVSAGFALVEFSLIAMIAWRRRGLDLAALPLLVTVFMVEAMEVIQWQFVEPLPSLKSGLLQCPMANWMAMIVAILSVTSQPLTIAYLLDKTNTNRSHASLFAFTKCASLILWLLYIASLIAGEVWGFNTANVDFMKSQQGFRSLFGHTTCAYAGPHGHLQWSIRLSLHELAPNALPYFMLFSLPLFWHRPAYLAALPIGGMLAIWVILLVVLEGNVGEAGSVWCFSGILLHLYYGALPYFWPEDEAGARADKEGQSAARKLQLGMPLAAGTTSTHVHCASESHPGQGGSSVRLEAIRKRLS